MVCPLLPPITRGISPDKGIETMEEYAQFSTRSVRCAHHFLHRQLILRTTDFSSNRCAKRTLPCLRECPITDERTLLVERTSLLSMRFAVYPY